MKLFAGIDARDRKLLFITLGAVVLLVIAAALFARNENREDNPVPSTYLTGQHGARAAFELLASSGYHIQRWETPLMELAQQVNANSVVILADPFLTNADDFKAVDEILRRGARVLATGFSGGALLPGSSVRPAQRLETWCQLTPQGLDQMADSGEVWMAEPAGWQEEDPRHHVQYDCEGTPAVVEYKHGAGHVVWWASATPLENGAIVRADNLNLFLNALGPRTGYDFYWDESTHGETRSQWYYARGAALNLLLGGMAGIALLVVFSFSRRSGPLRALPQPMRSTPVEFIESLGSLYGKAGAATTALQLAYDNFRRRMGNLCGCKSMQMNAQSLITVLRARFPQVPSELEEDLVACENELGNDPLEPKRALALVQKLNQHSEMLESLVRKGNKEWRN